MPEGCDSQATLALLQRPGWGDLALTTVDRTAVFEGLRPRLHGLAYRMLGSVGDAEDAVQDAYLRWHQADGGADDIRSPEAWLVTVVTRLCLDRMRALAAERAAYDGPWLPEPWPEAADEDGVPGQRLERAADLSIAFLALLERLSPEERAALLLAMCSTSAIRRSPAPWAGPRRPAGRWSTALASACARAGRATALPRPPGVTSSDSTSTP